MKTTTPLFLLSSTAELIMTKSLILLSLITIAVFGDLQDANPRPLDAFEDADSVLERYRGTVQEVLSLISVTLHETSSQMSDTGTAIGSIANRIIVQAQNQYLAQLADLETTLLGQGVDPSSCTARPKIDMSGFPNTLRLDINLCIRQMIRESRESINSAFDQFDHLNGTVEDYAQRIETCRSTNDEICAVTVIALIALHIDLLPVVVEQEIQEVVSQFGHMEHYFQSCTRGPTDQFYVTAKIIMDTVAMCVDNLLASKP